MMVVFLALFPIIVCENVFLTTSQKKQHHQGPVLISLNKLDQSILNRNTRSLKDLEEKDYLSNIKLNETILKNDQHQTAYVEWGGTDKGSETIIVLTRDSYNPPRESSLYISSNYGKQFNKQMIQVNGNNMVGTYIYQSPTNHRKFMINDEENKAVIVSTDEGITWKSFSLKFTPSLVEHHPVVDGLTMIYDNTKFKLYYTRNFGSSWVPILPDMTVVDYYWCNSKYNSDGQNTIYLTTRSAGKDGLLTVWKSSDFFVKSKTTIAKDVIEFLLVDDFYFVIKKSTHQKHGAFDRDLFISFDRTTLVKAQFPPEVEENPTNEFHIADAGLGQVFLVVSHKDNSTNLYVSEHKGHNMMLSLERILYTNQASYDQISWLAGVEPFADFQAIEGLPGVFIASQLEIGEVGHRRISTVMTFNKGGTWQRVQPPQYDVDGNPLNCFLPDCSLHISLMFGANYPYAKHTPLLSKENAPGLILAAGNVGNAHSTVADLFMSNDGGVEWFPVFSGQYYYQFADHGGITVAAPRHPTTVIFFSEDEGRTWLNKTISSKPVTIYGLITEPGEITTVFNVYATFQDKMEWIIITIDFKDYLENKCGVLDFMQWSIRDELKNTECVLGTNQIYERKIHSRHCYIGADYKRFIKNESCPCQATDFECDFLFERKNAGDPCLLVSHVDDSWLVPPDCAAGSFYNKSTGYIKIEGDQCVGGEQHIFDAVKVPCPDIGITNLTINVSPADTVKVGDTVTLSAHHGGYAGDVYYYWNIDQDHNKAGKGKNFQTIYHTFDYGTGTKIVTLTASNGAGPVVAMAKIEVDDELSSVNLTITMEPEHPVIEEGVVFVISRNHDLIGNMDVTRLKYEWTVAEGHTPTTTYIPILLYSYTSPKLYTLTCNISNSVSTITLTKTFPVLDLVINSLKAISVDTSSIQLMWLSPTQRSGLVSAYTLQYRSQTGSWKQFSLAKNLTHYQLDNLDAATEYTFIVKAFSISGTHSKESNTVTATTKAKNTLPAPTNVQVKLSGTAATVSWTASSQTPMKYVVEYWMSNVPGIPLTKTLDSDTTQTKLTDLSPGAIYTIRVATKYSQSVYSYAQVQHVQIEGVDPQALSNFAGSPLNDSAILLFWDSPKQSVSGYYVYDGSNSEKIMSVNSNQNEAVVTGLSPYTSYSFYVTPYLNTRTGINTKSISVTTDPGIPGKVKAATCLESNSKAVVSWHEPDQPNGPIVKYYLKSENKVVQKNLPKFVDGNVFQYSISGLQMYEVYNLEIIAQGPEKYSLPAFVTCSMTTGVPGPPKDLYIKTYDITTLELMWHHPHTKDVQSYEVQYGMVLDGKIGAMSVVNTTHLYAKLEGLTPSSLYSITIRAINSRGTGPKSDVITVSTLTPQIGSIEYEIKFSNDYNGVADQQELENAFTEEVVSVTEVSRQRITGVGITHKDEHYIKISFWMAPRSSPDSIPTERAVSLLDEAVKNGKFVVGRMKAESGVIEQRAVQYTSHHDVAEIVIPCVCGILVVLLITGLLYYRNRFHQLQRRHRITSHYATRRGSDDVNLIECAEETEGISSNDLQSGALTFSNESPQQPSRMKNFFNKFNYQPVDQEDQELLDDDEEHLLPL